VKSHVIEVGPARIRRLCCGGATLGDKEQETVALHSIDDGVALVDERPVSVPALWRDVLSSIACGAESVTVLHPSWWSPDRVAVVSAAARTVINVAQLSPRSSLLTRAAPSKSEASDTVVVEITDDFVVINGPEVVAETRHRDRGAVVQAVVQSVFAWARDVTTVVIDAPASVQDAAALAATIAKDLTEQTVVTVDDLRWRTLVAELDSALKHPRETVCRTTAGRVRRRLAPAGLAVTLTCVLVAGLHRQGTPAEGSVATTFTVEGHVALQVPAGWPVQRVVAGPGSARLQITSPTDPEAALHVTQSRVALPSLAATAEFLKSAIDEAPAGVFVDFNPADSRAGHPVATYREIRAGHDIRWTVWVDKAVRISIGCQSRRGRDEAVGRECDLAVRSARALD
jgi:type VII secretion-associated protein (TIGR03931 family)